MKRTLNLFRFVKVKTWTRFPFVRLLLPFLAGILVYGLFPDVPGLDGLSLTLVSLLLLTVLLAGSRIRVYRFRWIFGLGLNVFLIFLGYLLSLLNHQLGRTDHFSEFYEKGKVVYIAHVADQPAERPNSVKFRIQVTNVFHNGRLFRVNGKSIAYAHRDSISASLVYGSEILFAVHPEPVRKPANPGEFDYAGYLAVNNVFHQVYFGKGSFYVSGNNKGHWLKKFAFQMRDRLLATLRHYGITGREYAVAAALLIGYDDLLDASQRKEYAGAGVVHVLCVSGLHVGIVFLIAEYLFFFLRKQKKAAWIRPLLILAVIWTYAVITGLAPSVLRASLMFSLIVAGKWINRQSHTFNTLAASAFLLLVINPGMLYDLGFQLSYGAVAGIVAFQPHIRQALVTTNKITAYLWSMVNVSIAAQLLVTPISIYYFHQFPNYFLLANVIAIPLSGILIYSGVLFVFLSFVPLLGKIAAAILVLQIKLLNSSVAFIEGLPGAVSHNIYLTSVATILLYVLLFTIFMGYLYRKRLWLYASLALCVCLSAEYARVSLQRASAQSIIVHSVSKHTAIGFTCARVQHMMVDSVLLHDPSVLGYPLDGYRVKSGIRQVTYSGLATGTPGRHSLEGLELYPGGFFQFRGIKGVVVTPSANLPAHGKAIGLDLVILSSGTRIRLEKLRNCFPGAMFVADASNAAGKCKAWAKEAKQLGVFFYSVRESGAWVRELN